MNDPYRTPDELAALTARVEDVEKRVFKLEVNKPPSTPSPWRRVWSAWSASIARLAEGASLVVPGALAFAALVGLCTLVLIWGGTNIRACDTTYQEIRQACANACEASLHMGSSRVEEDDTCSCYQMTEGRWVKLAEVEP